MIQLQKDTQKVVEYIHALTDFTMVSVGTSVEFKVGSEVMLDTDTTYQHIGGTITDGILQAGLRYETVVKPRVEKIRAFHQAKTVSDFLNFMQDNRIEDVIDWHNNPEKVERIKRVAYFFKSEGIETEEGLKMWFEANPQNAEKFKQIKGIGNKSVDYFKILSGIKNTSAIDVHLVRFLENAGIGLPNAGSYEYARTLIINIAQNLKVEVVDLDHSIWKYGSSGKNKSKSNRKDELERVSTDYEFRMDKIFSAGGKQWKHRTLRTIFDAGSSEWEKTTIEQKKEILQTLLTNQEDIEFLLAEYKHRYSNELAKPNVVQNIESSLVEIIIYLLGK